MQLTVNLGDRSYPIIIENNMAQSIAQTVGESFPESRFAIITNTTLASLYGPLLASWKEQLGCSLYTMPDGEKYKTIDTWSGILNFLLEEKLERSSVLIAFGGGVVGDVAGFAAAAFLRGIACVQIPTTLLAMVDSSVGGKTAVDHPLGKNLIGAFHQPKKVYVDTSFLSTLHQREFESGYAELFKNAFIGGRAMFDFILSNHAAMLAKDPDVLRDGIHRSIAVKAEVVEQDEHETLGLRALLNFGHTFAHALERYYNFGELLHGEAVWWGMHCAIECALRCKGIQTSDLEAYTKIRSLLLTPALPKKPDPEAIYAMMFNDKKVSGGKLRLVLPQEPGVSVVRGDISAAMVQETIRAVLG